MKLSELIKEIERQCDGNIPYDYEIQVMEYIFDSAEYGDLEFDEIDVDHKRQTIFIK